MKRLIFVLFALASFATYGQKTNAELQTQITNEIKNKTYSPARAGDMFDQVNWAKQSVLYWQASGTNTYTVSVDGYSTYTQKWLAIQFPNASTGASTLNINGLGAVTISGVISGTLQANKIYILAHDGTNFQIVGGVSVSFGTDGQIPYTNSTGSNFSYSSEFHWDATNRRLIIGDGNTNSQGNNNYIIGNASSISFGNWNHILAESGIIQRTSGTKGVGNNGLFEGVNNTITTTSSHPYVGTFNMVMLGGSNNQAIDATQGVGYGGRYNILRDYAPTTGGIYAESAGAMSWAHGDQENYSLPPISTVPTQRVLASGRHSFNFSSNTPNQTVGHGALAQNSGILNGRNHNIPSDATNSVIVAGDSIKLPAGVTNTLAVPKFRIGLGKDATLPTIASASKILGRVDSDGQVGYVTIGSGLSYTNGTLSASGGGGGLIDQTLTTDIDVNGAGFDINFGSALSQLDEMNVYVNTYNLYDYDNGHALNLDPTGFTIGANSTANVAKVQTGTSDAGFAIYTGVDFASSLKRFGIQEDGETFMSNSNFTFNGDGNTYSVAFDQTANFTISGVQTVLNTDATEVNGINGLIVTTGAIDAQAGIDVQNGLRFGLLGVTEGTEPNGSMYYDHSNNLWRAKQNGAWYNMLGGMPNADKGDISTTSSGATWTIDNDVVTYAKMQNVSATNRFLGRITAGAGDTEELTGTQATTLLDNFTSALKGLAPASGGGTDNYLRADGTWAGAWKVTGTTTVTGNVIIDANGNNIEFGQTADKVGDFNVYSDGEILVRSDSKTTLNTTNGPTEINGSNIGILGASQNGGGTGVVSIGNASVNPTTNPTAGVIVYADASDGSRLKVRQPDGVVSELATTGTPELWYQEWDDFIWGTTNMGTSSGGWVESVSGTGADVAISSTGVNSTEKCVGVIALDCGTTTTGRSGLTKGNLTHLFGQGTEFRVTFRAALSALSDGTDTYTVMIGFTDGAGGSGTTGTDGAFFRYSSTNNAGEWEFITINNGTTTGTVFDTNVAPTATVNQKFEIRVNAAGTSVTAYIDDTLVATSTANIPTGSGRLTGIGAKIEKSAGTTSRQLLMDYYRYTHQSTSVR